MEDDMPTAGNLLAVDDDPRTTDQIEEYFVRRGFNVFTALDGLEMRAVLAREKIDVIILDMILPGESGIELAGWLKDRDDIGVIMLTGVGESVDRIISLETGADDFMSKPCDLRELLARVRSLMRRLSRQAGDAESSADFLTFGNWKLDLRRYLLVSGDEEDVELTTLEFNLLKAMVENANRVLSRDQLMNLTKGRDWNPTDRSIDNLISRLRRKIEPSDKRQSIIKTVQNAGYMLIK